MLPQALPWQQLAEAVDNDAQAMRLGRRCQLVAGGFEWACVASPRWGKQVSQQYACHTDEAGCRRVGGGTIESSGWR